MSVCVCVDFTESFYFGGIFFDCVIKVHERYINTLPVNNATVVALDVAKSVFLEKFVEFYLHELHAEEEERPPEFVPQAEGEPPRKRSK